VVGEFFSGKKAQNVMNYRFSEFLILIFTS